MKHVLPWEAVLNLKYIKRVNKATFSVDWGERRLLDGSSYSPMDGGGGHSPR